MTIECCRSISLTEIFVQSVVDGMHFCLHSIKFCHQFTGQQKHGKKRKTKNKHRIYVRIPDICAIGKLETLNATRVSAAHFVHSNIIRHTICRIEFLAHFAQNCLVQFLHMNNKQNVRFNVLCAHTAIE